MKFYFNLLYKTNKWLKFRKTDFFIKFIYIYECFIISTRVNGEGSLGSLSVRLKFFTKEPFGERSK